jgi:hypothetical protein
MCSSDAVIWAESDIVLPSTLCYLSLSGVELNLQAFNENTVAVPPFLLGGISKDRKSLAWFQNPRMRKNGVLDQTKQNKP